MDALIKPEFGLMFWTILIFVLLVFLLFKLAWKPLVDSVNAREEGIKNNVDNALKAKEEAEKIRKELEEKTASFKKDMEARLKEAVQEGDRRKEKILDEAKNRAGKLLENAKKELKAEKDKLASELRKEISDISLKAAEKVLAKSVDSSVNKEIVSRMLDEIGKTDKK